MGKLDKITEEWEQLFMQYKNLTGDSVICMVNKTSKKRLYFDVKLNRFLSKRESSKYTIDLTGKFLIKS